MYKNIRDLREDNDKKQIELALLLNISQQQYSNIENGISEPNGKQIIKLAKYYNVTTDYILGYKKNPPSK